MVRRRPFFWFTLAVAVAAAAYFHIKSRNADEVKPANTDFRPRLVLVVAGPDAFHQQVIVGAKKAAEELNAELKIEVPDGTGAGQTKTLVECSSENIDGLAVSPLAPEEQTALISRLASKMKVVTYDNDVPSSLRHASVGANNAMGGRLAANLVKKALPDGGKVAIFIGDNERQNARVRLRAVINVLGNLREDAESQSDEDLGDATKAGKYEVVGTFFDDSDPEKALANAKKVLADHPDLKGMIALYGYDGPACLKALNAAGKLKQIPLIAFDEHAETLAGIESGAVVGTVVQDPFLMGYKAIEELCRLCRNDVVALPLPGMGSYTLACVVVDKDNLGKFRDDVAQRLAKNPGK